MELKVHKSPPLISILSQTNPLNITPSYFSKFHFNIILPPTRHYATSRKVAGSILDEVIGLSSWPNPSSRPMDLVLTQLLTEMSTRNLPGGKGRLVRKAVNLVSICEPIV
jgi:hypothetical protein